MESAEHPTDAAADAIADVDAQLMEQARQAAVGHPELIAVLERLDSLHAVEPDDLPGEFDAIHRLLRAALGDAP